MMSGSSWSLIVVWLSRQGVSRKNTRGALASDRSSRRKVRKRGLVRENEGGPCPVAMVNLDDAMVRKEGRGRGVSGSGVGC